MLIYIMGRPMQRIIGCEEMQCKLCGKVLNLRGTPKQVLIRISMHFTKHGSVYQEEKEINHLIRIFENLPEWQQAEEVEKLLFKYFSPVPPPPVV